MPFSARVGGGTRNALSFTAFFETRSGLNMVINCARQSGSRAQPRTRHAAVWVGECESRASHRLVVSSEEQRP